MSPLIFLLFFGRPCFRFTECTHNLFEDKDSELNKTLVGIFKKYIINF